MIPIKYRIAGIIFFLEAIMLVVVLGYAFSSYWQQNIDRLNHEEQLILGILSEFARTALLTGDFSVIQDNFERRTDDHTLNIILTDAANQVVASSSSTIMVKGVAAKDSDDPLTYWKSIDIENQAGKYGALKVQFSKAKLLALHSQVRNRSIILGISGMFIIAIIAISAGHFLTRRLDKVTHAANRITKGERDDIKTNISGHDEIAILAHAFDQMVEDKLQNEQSLEKQVKERTAALESSNKELQAFSYTISHDLRSPLRTIDGFSHILLEDYANVLDNEGKKYLQRIRTATQNMEHLIDDILELSRVGRHKVQPSQVNLSKHATLILDELKFVSPDRLIEVTIEPNIIVEGDEMLLHLVMENLIGNAWKYTSKKQTGVITIGTLEKNIVFVRDNGAGFDMNYAEKLFKPFHRLHSPDDFEGTGIGLATVSRIIEKHGGKVWGEGEVDKGATFYFEL